MPRLYTLICLAILSQTILGLLQRKFLKRTKYEYAFTVLWQIISGLLVLPLASFDHMRVSLSPQLTVLFIISLIFWALTNIFYLSSYKYEEASVLSPIFPLYNVIAYVISIIFFAAHADAFTLLGFVSIIAASILSGFYRTKFRPSKGVILGLLSVLFEGIALALSIDVTKNFSIPLYIVLGFSVPGFINLLFFLRPKFSELRYEISHQWYAIVLCAIVVDLFYLFEFSALRIGTTAQVVSFGSVSTFLIVVGGIIFLRERKDMGIKIIAALLATIGVILAQF